MNKMKLDKAQKRFRKKETAKLIELGGFGASDSYTRRTMVWRPIFKGSKMGKMAVATCHPSDKFSRKYGEYLTLENIIWDACIVVDIETAMAVYSSIIGV